MFKNLGLFVVAKDAVDEDKLMEVALDAGADDIRTEGDEYEIVTTPEAYDTVEQALADHNIPTEHAQITMVPDTTIALSPEDAQKLESALLAAFKKAVEKGIEVKSDAQLAGGFRIGVKDGSAYYDFSAESVADLFSAYISSRAARLLKDAVKEL